MGALIERVDPEAGGGEAFGDVVVAAGVLAAAVQDRDDRPRLAGRVTSDRSNRRSPSCAVNQPVVSCTRSEAGAATLEEQRVAPHPVELTDAFAAADDAEPDALVGGDAGGVLREDAGLDRPVAGALRARRRGRRADRCRRRGRGGRGGCRRCSRRPRRTRSDPTPGSAPPTRPRRRRRWRRGGGRRGGWRPSAPSSAPRSRRWRCRWRSRPRRCRAPPASPRRASDGSTSPAWRRG